MQINSLTLSDNIIKDMKGKIKETKKAKIELGFALCLDKDNNIIKKGIDCTGTKCLIKIGSCPTDQTHLGNFHTHPRTYPTMSITDMIAGCAENVECIGSVPSNTIRCFIRKTDQSQCNDEVKPFEDTEYKLTERREDIKKTLKSPISIIKRGIPQFIKTIIQYEKDIDKYHINRAKLLKKNFDQINIK